MFGACSLKGRQFTTVGQRTSYFSKSDFPKMVQFWPCPQTTCPCPVRPRYTLIHLKVHSPASPTQMLFLRCLNHWEVYKSKTPIQVNKAGEFSSVPLINML
ncbi:hypothetical protein XELAEV_18023009mg [Xenopus laevis]|uniref:Uncharacterized protein n=1 Tax=Xenopus laevis TaxID=8355 RepID=A0A974D612_XENLA|nr:hypothetical protein XELAEV_18023009mg [Xenopus laevis]